MVAFAFVYREAVERYASRCGFTAALIVDGLHPCASALWTRLEEGVQPST